MKMIRQGDVLLIPVTQQAVNLNPKPTVIKARKGKGKIVLAVGETSAHEHTIEETDAELIEQGGRILLTILRDTELAVTDTRTGQRLPRHTAKTVMPGLYEVRTQRELDVREMRPRPVFD